MINNDLNLFFSKKEKKFYFVGEEKCNACKQDIEHLIFIQVVLDPLISFKKYFCVRCVNKIHHPKQLNYSECKPAIIVTEPPKDAHPYWFVSPVLTNSNNLSVFEAAAIHDCNIIDKTCIACRESWEGSQIGSSDKVKELDAHFNEPTELLLENIKSSQPLLPEKKEAAKLTHSAKTSSHLQCSTQGD